MGISRSLRSCCRQPWKRFSSISLGTNEESLVTSSFSAPKQNHVQQQHLPSHHLPRPPTDSSLQSGTSTQPGVSSYTSARLTWRVLRKPWSSSFIITSYLALTHSATVTVLEMFGATDKKPPSQSNSLSSVFSKETFPKLPSQDRQLWGCREWENSTELLQVAWQLSHSCYQGRQAHKAGCS